MGRSLKIFEIEINRFSKIKINLFEDVLKYISVIDIRFYSIVRYNTVSVSVEIEGYIYIFLILGCCQRLMKSIVRRFALDLGFFQELLVTKILKDKNIS